MTRQLTITAAEWASVQPDGSLWLVREGDTRYRMGTFHVKDGSFTPTEYGPVPIITVPAEFVQACAPCGTCGDGRHFGVCHDCWAMTTGPWCPNCGGDCGDVPCPACRIELVGPCPHPANRLTRPLDGNYGAGGQKCRDCLAYRTDYTDWSPPEATVTLGYAYAIGQPLLLTAENIGHHYFRLAHYGPPETLVDRWAIQLAVVQ